MSDITQSRNSPASVTGNQITLQVGERRFVTTRETLVGESAFFASLLSGRWDNAEEDNSYFIDADAKLFDHILRYLRRGILPIFYDKMKGHDYALYLALLEEAKYFQITQLKQWLEKKRYLHAIMTTYSATEIEGVEEFRLSRDTDLEVEHYPAWGTKKVYICPRGIYAHEGKPSACGRDCMRARGDADDIYEEQPVLRALVVEKKTVFDMQACLAGQG